MNEIDIFVKVRLDNSDFTGSMTAYYPCNTMEEAIKLKEAIVNKWKQESEDNQLMHVVEDTDDAFLAKDEYSPNEFAVNVFTQPRMTVSQILDELDSDGFFI